MAKPIGTTLLLLVITLLAVIPSAVSAQSTCSTGTAVVNAANSPGLTDDCNALLAARDTLVGNAMLNWSADLAIVNWDGVTVDGTPERVTGLNLRAYRLNGEIPTELGRLANLESLHLGENQLTGEIPAELGGLANIEGLYLNGNRLTGKIPAALSSLASLERLYLNGNRLTGEIPAELGSLINLRVLSLSQNQFTGEIPSSLDSLTRLERLYLNENQLNGEIPAELGGLARLERLYLNENRLTGEIPAELGSLINLRVLSLSQNQFTGEIPSALGSLTSLEHLYLDGNRLTGEIPAELARLANLQDLRLGNNQLAGCIPQGLREAVSDSHLLSLPFCGTDNRREVPVIIARTSPDAPVRFNSPISLKATFSEPVFGFTAEDISVAYGAAGNFAGNDGDALYTFDVTPTAAGAVTVNIAAGTAEDTDGNGNKKAAPLSLGIPYDDDNDGSISKNQAINAVIDYLNDLINKEQTIGVIILYLSAPIVTPNEANAGPDSEALELSTIMLDGTLSSGPDGSISSYQWEQVITGARIVSLTNADTAEPSFTLPPLGGDQDFVFRLIVTYNSGETSSDEVTIKGRPAPGVIIGAVSGNTASLNAVAEFRIRLRSRPSANVVIPLSSSDVSEGALEQAQVVFTPENWSVDQLITVRGRNASVQGGVQAYEIILGDSESSDSVYDGLETANVAMKGIALEITPPQRIEPLIANLPSTIEPTVTHTGSELLSFALTQAPAGMSIDFSYGIISWTPEESDEGRTFNITVRATDGARFAQTSFQVTVIQPEPLVTRTEANVLTIADPTTTLNGVSVTALPPDTGTPPATLPTLEKAPTESVPETPPWITRITDVFVVKSSFDNPVDLRFPISQLPDGISPGNVNLYAYVEATDVEGQFWSPVAIERSSEGTEDSPVYVVSLAGLQGLAFFGYHSTTPAIPLEPATSSNNQGEARSVASSTARSSISVTPPMAGSIECKGAVSGMFTDWNNRLCTYTGDDAIKIKVLDFGNKELDTRWSGKTTIEDLAQWLIEAHQGFEKLGLGYDKEITVLIHDTKNALGYVTTKGGENRRTLHITDDNTENSSIIQGTAVHEYFHHAQGHGDTNDENGETALVIDKGKKTKWVTEGTARWFEDELYDGLNTYETLEVLGFRIMEAGVDSIADVDVGIKRPYQRFSFFKLLNEKCDDFYPQFKNVLNADPDDDPTGIKNLSGLLDDANCDFGGHLGSDLSGSLAAAIAYYNYATQFKNDISLLDGDEPSSGFIIISANSTTLPTDLTNSSHDCPDTSLSVVHTLYLRGYILGKKRIPPNGAYSIRVPESGCSLPTGKVVELIVESTTGEVIASISSDSSDFIGTNSIGMGSNNHGWFSTTGETSYVFAKGPTGSVTKTIPEIFVTLVNPNLESVVGVTASIAVRDELVDLGVDATITSPGDGDQVSNRVVTIRGSIPEGARDATKYVIITANGLETETLMNLDGSYVADVVVGFGDNSIKAQGVDAGGTAVTNETKITIEGVKSLFTRRNALIPSRVVFVLRWDTYLTDVDIYSTDKNGGTLWYLNLREGPGNLDHDDINGFGPEVVSYRATNADIYDDGTFKVDVHYFSGSPSTNYTLDVILNETNSAHRRLRRFESTVPLTVSRPRENGPNGSGPSRFNGILSVFCSYDISSGTYNCGLTDYDKTKLAPAGGVATTRSATSATRSVGPIEASQDGLKAFSSAYAQCMTELEATQSKSGSVEWSCNPDGAKQWP